MTGHLKVLALAALVSVGLFSGTRVQAAESAASTLSQFKWYGFSSKTDMKNYFSVKTLEVKEQPALITPEVLDHLNRLSAPAPSNAGPITPSDLFEDLLGLDVESWIALGQKVWQVVVANKPVANVSTQRVSVLPMAQQDWVQMENWRGPAVKTFTIEAKNIYGVTVISHSYTIAYNYGGSFQGKGQFLANATVIPTRVSVSWGFTLNSEVEVGHILNTGTKTEPIPGVDLQLKWTMDSVLKHLEGRESFFLKGDGNAVQVAGGL